MSELPNLQKMFGLDTQSIKDKVMLNSLGAMLRQQLEEGASGFHLEIDTYTARVLADLLCDDRTS